MKDKTVAQILQQTREIYNRIASDFSRTRSRWWHGFGNVSKYVKPGDKVLDLGCGNGRMGELFLTAGVKYLGIDNSQELIKIAQNRFKDQGEFSFSVGDILNSPWGENNFNLVLCIAVLHHLPTKKLRLKALKNIYESLAPQGTAIISTWNLWQPRFWRYLLNYQTKGSKQVWRFSDAFIPWKLKTGWQPRYVHAFTIRELKKLLAMSGLKVERINYQRAGQPVSFWRGENIFVVAKKC